MDRLVTSLLIGIAVFWTGACFWIRGSGIPDWWLAVSVMLGIACGTRTPPTEERASPPWARVAAWTAIGTAFATMWLGAVATPSRHWDGAASFDAKVFWLQRSPTLQQPFFAAEGVFHHSPDYPLLLPMLVATVERAAPEFGRTVLLFVYMLLCGVVTVALQRRAIAPLLRVAITVAVAVTPALLNTSGGAVDSGYSECLLLLATTTVAAGFLNQRPGLFATGIVLLIATKPEGQAYAMVALAVAFARCERKLLWPGVAALFVACLVWEPVQAALLHRESRPWMTLPTAVLALTALLLGLRRLMPALATSRASRWALVLGLPIAGLLVLPWIAAPLAEGQGTIAIYMRRAQSVFTGLGNLPAYFLGVLEFGVLRLRLGTVLLIPLATSLVAWHRGIKLADRSVLLFAALGLATTALPFVLSPEPDIQHHIRSSLPRLLLHWVGPLWLLSAGWLDTVLDTGPAADQGERCQSPAAASS